MPYDTDSLSRIVGKHLVFQYANGWRYEMYVKNATTIDYRVHSGLVANRWVKDQTVCLVDIAPGIFKNSWYEPTGSGVSQTINLNTQRLHGVIFFPQWVVQHPERTICFQNDHVADMERYRDAGPTYPTEMIDEFAEIIYLKDVGTDDEHVIDCPPNELPADYFDISAPR